MLSSVLRLPRSEDVAVARGNIRGFAVHTPLLRLNPSIPGVNIYLKLENLQPQGSFKIRAAVNFLKSMDLEAAGAASVAVAMAGQAGKGNIVCIVSGGNIDGPKLGAILNGQSPF